MPGNIYEQQAAAAKSAATTTSKADPNAELAKVLQAKKLLPRLSTQSGRALETTLRRYNFFADAHWTAESIRKQRNPSFTDLETWRLNKKETELRAAGANEQAIAEVIKSNKGNSKKIGDSTPQIPDTTGYNDKLSEGYTFYNEGADNYVDNRTNDTVDAAKDTYKGYKKANEGDRDTALDIDPMARNPYQNWNHAKDKVGGNLNQRTFDTTLKYQRDVDTYNTKPQDNITHFQFGGVGRPGISASSEVAYNRPQVETEETREMARNRELDQMRQAGRVGLQNTVDTKRNEAYDKYLEHLYEATGKRYDREYAARMWSEQQKALNVIQKETLRFTQDVSLAYKMKAANKVLEVAKYNPAMANFVAACIGASYYPDPQTKQYYDVALAYAKQYMAQHGHPDAKPEDITLEAWSWAWDEQDKLKMFNSFKQTETLTENEKKGKKGTGTWSDVNIKNVSSAKTDEGIFGIGKGGWLKLGGKSCLHCGGK